MAALCAAILGLADPTLAPRQSLTGSANPVLLLMDGSWAGAPHWDQQIRKAETILDMAGQDSRPAAVRVLTDAAAFGPGFQDARDWAAQLPNLSPRPWLPDAAAAARRITDDFQGRFDTYWLTDGLQLAGHASLVDLLGERGRVVVVRTGAPPAALRPAGYEDGGAHRGVWKERTVTAGRLSPLKRSARALREGAGSWRLRRRSLMTAPARRRQGFRFRLNSPTGSISFRLPDGSRREL